MAKKFKAFVERDKPRKRPRRHKKNLSKSEKRDHKPYNRQGRKQQINCEAILFNPWKNLVDN